MGWIGLHRKFSIGLVALGALLLLVLVGAASVTHAQRGPDDLTAPEGDPSLDVLACYQLGPTKFPEEDPFLKAGMETDNFGMDVVNIYYKHSPFLCESAVKTHVGDTATLPYGKLGNHVFQCFDVQRGAIVDDDYALTTHNFGTEPVTVGQAIHMCESARKTLGADSLGRPGTMAMHCFTTVALPDVDGNLPEHGAVSLTTDNFGSRVVDLGQSSLLCEEAAKHTSSARHPDIGKPTGRVWQCFSAEEQHPSELNASVKLTTSNFGDTEVSTGKLIMMCERAKKSYIFTATVADGISDGGSGDGN